MKTTFSILFLIKTTRLLKNGNAPILLRITANTERVEISIKRDIPVKLWSQSGECSRGKDANAKILNHYINTIRNKIIAIHSKMVEDSVFITASLIKERYLRGEENLPEARTICGIYGEHNRKIWALVGKEYSKSTAEKFDTSLKCLKDFIYHQYKFKDLSLSEINGEFIRNLEFYLKTERNCQHNSAIKHLKNLKKIVIMAINNEWMIKSPFLNIPFRIEKIDKTALTQEQVERIMNKEITNERISRVRDIFVFCCMTGLAFIDVVELKPEHIIESNGHKLIVKKRHKTDQECRVNIINIAYDILIKYMNSKDSIKQGTIFSLISNQKMNNYLKEIADLCNIDINLTTHTARHVDFCLSL